MVPIQISEIYAQYLTLKEEIDSAISEVIKSTQFIKSGKTLAFEDQLSNYLNTNVIGCGNGTDAIQIAFMALGLQPDDEIITTPFTFISTVEVLVLLRLKPVFVDISPDTFNINEKQIKNAITKNTKAILPVHLYGQSSNMEAIQSIAKKYNLYVIEDACQSLGTNYLFKNGITKKSGTIGDIGCTSFFPSKTLGAYGDGGAIFCNDKKNTTIIRSIANHGMAQKYKYERIGINSRLDSIQAAILGVKLKYLENHIKERQKVADFYDDKLKNIREIKIPHRVAYSSHTFHQYTIQTGKRDELQLFLKAKGIPTIVYYPESIHLQSAYSFLGYKRGDFPIAEKICQTVLSLPMHTELDDEQLNYIVESIKEFFVKNRNRRDTKTPRKNKN